MLATAYAKYQKHAKQLKEEKLKKTRKPAGISTAFEVGEGKKICKAGEAKKPNVCVQYVCDSVWY